MMSSIKTFPLRYLLLALLLCCGGYSVTAAQEKKPGVDAPHVLVTIAPLHSLVAGLMEGVGEPGLLLKGQSSPHHYALKPSDACNLMKADVVVYTSAEAERYMLPLMEAMPERKHIKVEAMDIPGMVLYPSPLTEEHLHGLDRDMHIWLDPVNAIAFTQYMEEILTEADSAHAKQYAQNAARQIERLQVLHNVLEARFVSSTGGHKAAYAMYHPALQYFEKRYHINGSRIVTDTPESGASVAEAEALEEAATTGELRCLFREPQYSPHLLNWIAEEHSNIALVTVDHLGSEFAPGPQLYEQLLLKLADVVYNCLQPAEGAVQNREKGDNGQK